MGLTIKCFEDNEPLKHMKATKGLLWIIRQVRDAKLDLDDSRMVKAAAKSHGLTPDEIANARRFFAESNDRFALVDTTDGN